ncbi:MAG: hypothetical protein WAO20_06610 [Acidobacteriota bacterium]|jgi:hypothetical protein
MIRSEERDDINPVCPHCKAEITRIGYRTIESTLGKRFLYFCLACRACLGVSHRKGFWMG